MTQQYRPAKYKTKFRPHFKGGQLNLLKRQRVKGTGGSPNPLAAGSKGPTVKLVQKNPGGGGQYSVRYADGWSVEVTARNSSEARSKAADIRSGGSGKAARGKGLVGVQRHTEYLKDNASIFANLVYGPITMGNVAKAALVTTAGNQAAKVAKDVLHKHRDQEGKEVTHAHPNGGESHTHKDKPVYLGPVL